MEGETKITNFYFSALLRAFTHVYNAFVGGWALEAEKSEELAQDAHRLLCLLRTG